MVSGADEPVELTEPVDVVAWLRALPVDVILRDEGGDAWRLTDFPALPLSRPVGKGFRAFTCTGDDELYLVRSDEEMSTMAKRAPFRVLWTPGGGT